MNYKTWTDEQLLAENRLIIENLEQISDAVENSIKPIPDDEAERASGLSDELEAIQNELVRRGYHFSPYPDDF